MANVIVDIPHQDLNLDILREALAGGNEKISASVALGLILELDLPHAGRMALVLETIQNKKVDLLARAGAVRQLVRFDLESAVSGGLKALESSEERIAAAAAAVLGQVGNEQHLPALKRARTRAKAGEFLRRRAAFGEALIVHRFGLTSQKVELPKAGAQIAPTPGSPTFASTEPGRDRRVRAIESVKREFPSLDAARQVVYEVQCGPRLLEFVFDRDFVGAAGIEARAERPGLPGFVAFHGVEEDDFYPRLILFSSPAAKKNIKLLITTMTGEPVYVGGGSVSEKNSAFELHSVKSPGIVPVAARIRLTPQGVEIAGVSDRNAVPAEGPKKMTIKAGPK